MLIGRLLSSRGRYAVDPRGAGHWRPVAAGVLALVVVASAVTSVVWTSTDHAYAYFITPTRAREFGAGALLAFVPSPGRGRGPGARAVPRRRVLRGVPVALLQEPGCDVSTDCRITRELGLLYDPQPGAVERLGRPDVTLIDFTDVYCNEDQCFPVVGGVTVYRDPNHLTNTFARTLEPYFEAELTGLLPRGRG